MNNTINLTEEVVKNLLETKVSHLQEIIDASESSDYMITSLLRMYSMMTEVGQYSDHFNSSEIRKVKRLIRCKRYIPNYTLDVHKADRVIIGGLYMIADVYVFPTKLLQDNMKKHKGGISHPEEDGLPPESMVNYGTSRIIGDFSVALSKDSWVNEWITRTSQYEYVNLQI